MDFYAVGAFLHTLTAIGAVDADGRYIPSVGFDKAFEYCRKVTASTYFLLVCVSCNQRQC